MGEGEVPVGIYSHLELGLYRPAAHKHLRENDVYNFGQNSSVWDLAVQKSEKVKVLIEVRPHLEFQDPNAPRLRKVPMKLQASIGEEESDYTMFREAIDNCRTKTYFSSLDLAINELESKFSENDQDILCALSDMVMNLNPKPEYFDLMADNYNIDNELLMIKHDLFYSYKENNPNRTLDTPRDVLAYMHSNDQLNFLPHFDKVVKILNIIPASSCYAERSFSALRRLKTYLRNTISGGNKKRYLAFICKVSG